MKRRPTNIQTGFLFLIFAACGTEVQKADHYFEITVKNGIPTARTTGGPKYEADLFSYEFVAELQEDEREESLLLRPSGDFHMDERGWLYVPEYGDRRIAVFDSAGRYSHSIGREGSGPGEFRGDFDIVGLSDGMVTVSDRSQNRITRFTTDGDLIEVIPVRGPSIYVHVVYPVGEDLFLGRAEETSLSSGTLRMRPIAYLHNASGDTLASVTTPWFDFAHRDRTDNVSYQMVFQPSAAFAFQEGFGFFVTTGESPSLDVYDLSGQVARRIDLGLEKVPTTPQDRARLREYYDAEMDAEGVDEQWREYLATQRDHQRVSEYRAFWRSAQIDDAGFIWLEVPQHPLDEKTAEYHGLWRVVSPEGEYLGLTRRPPRSGRVMRGHVLTLDVDMEALTYRLRVYRITPAVDGLIYP